MDFEDLSLDAVLGAAEASTQGQGQPGGGNPADDLAGAGMGIEQEEQEGAGAEGSEGAGGALEDLEGGEQEGDQGEGEGGSGEGSDDGAGAGGEGEGEGEGDGGAGDDESLIAEIISSTGLEGLNPEDYTEDTEGYAKLLKDATKKNAQIFLQDLFGQDPELKAHFEFKLMGGDSKKFFDTYFNPANTTALEVSEDDSTTQDRALTEYFKMKNVPEDEIKGYIEDFELAGKKFERAQKAAEFVNQARERQKAELVENQRKQAEEAQKAQAENWKKVTSFIDEAKGFKGIALPPAEKKEFIDYISKPVDDQGRSQRDIDIANADMETLLAIDLILKRGLDLSKLASIKQETSQARSLRGRTNTDNGKKGPRGGAAVKGTGGYNPKLKVDDLDFSALGLG